MFTHFIFIDWSAANAPTGRKPRRDAIWLAHGEIANQELTTQYIPTRRAAYAYVREYLVERVRQQQRTLCGLDIGYGYPAGFAPLLGCTGPDAWQQLWALLYDRIEDDDRNRNNRYTVAAALNRQLCDRPAPFWGHPPRREYEYLLPKRQHFQFPLEVDGVHLAEFRTVDRRQRGLQSAWKLHYPASVGSQILMGIPYLYRLRFLEPELEQHSLVWPQETDFTATPLPDGYYILHAEIWPGLLAIPPEPGVIRDRLQVQGMVEWARQLVATGELARYFLPPDDLSNAQLQVVRQEEGWVLGIH